MSLVASAWAAGPYSVSVHVPATIAPGHRLTVTIAGRAPAPAILYIALDARRCATSIKQEILRRPEASEESVQGRFQGAFKASAAQDPGRNYVCAYLGLGAVGTKLANDITKANASATYRVT